MKVTVSKRRQRGEFKWVVDFKSIRGRQRHSFTSEASAKREAARLVKVGASADRDWKRLTESDRDRLMLAFREAKTNGHDLAALIEDSKSRPGTDYGPAVETVITELAVSKSSSGRDDGYVNGLKTVLKQFAKGRERIKIGRISFTDIESFLSSKSLAYRSTLRSRLSTMFKFAIRRGYRADNPCDRLEPITYHKPSPAIFTVEQFKTAAQWLLENEPHGLAWFALTTVCGLRPEEAEKTEPSSINFKEGFIKVEAQTTKVRQRRVVYPKAEAMKFLKWSLDAGGRLPLSHSSRMRIIAGEAKKRKWKPIPGRERAFVNRTPRQPKPGLRDALGFKAWPKDITRHTAASYWLADCGSAVIVSEALGNSESVLKRDYKALVTKVEARQFWKAVLFCFKSL